MPVVDTFWYRLRPAHLVLFPASLLFGAVIAVRRTLYARGILASERLPVPVIVVGNISVGGTGKTPLCIWLAQRLAQHGYSPGIVMRGYGGTGAVQAVAADADPAAVGDEAVLLARRCDCPVWTGRKRVQAARALLAHHPSCNVIISDDGLQHYALQRDVEIVVVDGERRFGNGCLLPAGPLREPLRRLQAADAIVVNGGSVVAKLRARQYRMWLRGERLVNLLEPARSATAEAFAGQTVDALAAIGNPGRFFAHLRSLGLRIRPQPFPDHFAFTPDDLAFAGEGPLLMTEKDAVKCARFARENYWYLPIDAEVDAELERHIIEALKASHGREAAGNPRLPGHQGRPHPRQGRSAADLPASRSRLPDP
jgi:tetraacyldisaccharide 4'-kinase